MSKNQSEVVMAEIPLRDYSLMCQQIGFLEGTLLGLQYLTDPDEVHAAIKRYAGRFGLLATEADDIQLGTTHAPSPEL